METKWIESGIRTTVLYIHDEKAIIKTGRLSGKIGKISVHIVELIYRSTNRERIQNLEWQAC